MAGNGFNSDPLQFVNLVRDNLRDRYETGFPILKELLQNAKDARATQFEFGLHPGISKASHSLLKGPALVVVNDGKFTPTNAKAIKSFGLSDKGQDSASVGKFGLGLKSVFHLAEAFFYFSSGWSAEESKSQKHQPFGLLNPFSASDDEGLHDDWDHEWSKSGSGDRETVVAQLQELNILPGSAWFCLWIPLRQREHCVGCEGRSVDPIVKHFYDTAEARGGIVPPDWAESVAAFMPLLTPLVRVRWHNFLQSGKCQSVTLKGTSIRLASPGHSDEEGQFSGTVEIERENRSSSVLAYKGIEALPSLPELDALVHSDQWPTLSTYDRETGQGIQEKEKAVPHCAVVIGLSDTKEHGCYLQHDAVFLPLGDSFKRTLGGNLNLNMLLHGCFFVDAGRKHIARANDGASDPEAEIRGAWNNTIKRLCLLPLIPQILKDTLESGGLSEKARIGLVSSVLQATDSAEIEFLSSKNQLLPVIAADGKVDWILHSAGEEFFQLPELSGEAGGILLSLAYQTPSPKWPLVLPELPKVTTVAPKLLPFEFTVGLLEKLANERADSVKSRNEITLKLLTNSTRPEHWETNISDLQVFRGRCPHDQYERSFSLEEIRGYAARDRLWNLVGGFTEIVKSVVQAFPPVELLLLDEEAANILGFDLDRFELGAAIQITLSGETPSKSTSSLFSILIRNLPSARDEQRLAARYLLHKEPEQIQCESLLFDANADTEHEAIRELFDTAHTHLDGGWRLIHDSLLEDLSPAARSCLGIARIDIDAVESLVRECNPHELDCSVLPREIKRELILSLKDIDIIRGLNIHETVTGDSVRLNNNSYLESDFEELPEEFTQLVQLIRNDESLYLRRVDGELLIDPLDWSAVVRIALGQPNAQDYWRSILAGAGKAGDSLGREMLDKVRSSNWLPRNEGDPVAPRNVAYIESALAELDNLLKNERSPLVPFGQLAEEVSEHPQFKTFANTFWNRTPAQTKILSVLAEHLSENPSMLLGLSVQWTPDEVEEWISVCGSSVRPQTRVFALIEAIKGPTVCSQGLISMVQKLSRPQQVDKATKILNQLTSAAENSSGELRKKLLNWHLRYFKNASRTQPFQKQILPRLKLPAADGSYRKAEELTIWKNGISTSHVLSQVYRETTSRPEGDSFENDPSNRSERFVTPDRFVEMLEPVIQTWTGIPKAVIGTFVALLGQQGLDVARHRLRECNRNIEAILDRIESDCPSESESTLQREIQSKSFTIDVVRGKMIEVANLLGARISLQRDTDVESLLIGSRCVHMRSAHGQLIGMRFIDIAPEVVGRDRFIEILRKTAAIILEEAYNRTVSLTNLWAELAEAQSLDIEKAQIYLINSAITVIQQTGISYSGPLKEVMKRLDEAQHRQAEERRGIARQRQRAATDRDKAEDTLRKLLETDPSIQRSILSAIRDRVREHYQYEVDSIPFELWQNADDAYEQLYQLFPELKKKPARFVLQISNGVLRAFHWGRPINLAAGTSDFDGMEHEYHRDLEKMLVFSTSSKGHLANDCGQTLTGKFGLGFKSVFLACSHPRVRSAELGFSVIGGIYPKHLDAEGVKRLEEVGPNDSDGITHFELPLDEPAIADSLAKRFRQLAPLALIFANHVRQLTINIEGADGLSNFKDSWNESPLVRSKDGCVYIGKFREIVGEATHAVVFRRTTERGPIACAIGIGRNGVCKLPNHVPTLWITAPLRESPACGFSVNALFDPDVGRAQLAQNSQKNQKLAEDLAGLIRDGFGELHEWLTDGGNDQRWPMKTSTYEFWKSFLDLLTPVNDSQSVHSVAAKLLGEIVWPKNGSGAAGVVETLPVIPSELPGEYCSLLSLADIKGIVSGILSETEEFRKAAQWDAFRVRFAPGHLVSKQTLDSIPMAQLPDADEVSIVSILSCFVGDEHQVGFEAASSLGQLINSDLFEKHTNRGAELEHLKSELKNLRFRSKNGAFHNAKDLLIPESTTDEERRRASFAPDETLVDSAYAGTSLAFVDACRDTYRADSSELATWLTDCEDRNKRIAGLKYLVDGQLADEMGRHLVPNGRRGWMANLELSNEFRSLPPNEQTEIRWKLRLFTAQPTTPPPPPPPVDGRRTLLNIYEWWEAERKAYIPQYEATIYPNGCRPQLGEEGLRDDVAVRKGWLTLLLSGVFHTIGRSTAKQSRGFLEFCDRNGWLEKFANPNPNQNPRNWISVLEEYFTDRVQFTTYFHWFRQFVSIYQFSRWLPEYAERFLSLEYEKEPFELTSVVSPGLTIGFDAPSGASSLNLGACFVVRELVRRKILKNPVCHPHCFLPARRLMSLLEMLGFWHDGDSATHQDSKRIHKFLNEEIGVDRAKFCGDFDIPLLLVAERQDLQKKLLSEIIEFEGEDNF